MAVFLLAYDLRNEAGSHNYEPLWDELNRLKAQRTQDSLWLINLNNSPTEVLEHFKGFVDGDDRLWITEILKGRHTFVNAKAGTNAWLGESLPRVC